MPSVARHRAMSFGDFFALFDWFVGFATYYLIEGARKPKCTDLVRDSRVRDWLWLEKVLAPPMHPT